jgi:hypothetical protein
LENIERSGFGKLYYPDGSLFEGYFEQGLAVGNSRMIYSNGDAYIGEWKNDKFNG